jgi:hypothetical protein
MMKKIGIFRRFWDWIKHWFSPRYKITVFRTNEFTENVYKESYISRRILIQKINHLKFKDEHKKIVELRAAKGLDYRIVEL